MIREELMLGTAGIPKNTEAYKIISEMANKISDAMNDFFRDDIFAKYLEMTKEALTALVYVNSKDFNSILMCPIVVQTPITSSMFEAHAVNALSYKKCKITLPTLTLEIVCLHVYKGEPTCDIKKVWKSL